MNTHFVAMERLTNEQRVFILKIFNQSHESPEATVRKLRTTVGRKELPTLWTV